MGGNHVKRELPQQDIGSPACSALASPKLVGDTGELALASHGDAVQGFAFFESEEGEGTLDRLLALGAGGWGRRGKKGDICGGREGMRGCYDGFGVRRR